MHNFPKKQFEEIKAKVESIESRFGQVIRYWEWFSEALKEVKLNSNSLQRLKRYMPSKVEVLSLLPSRYLHY
jgi:hypothetical protein